jgi:signal transduction histidine kinase
MSRINFLKTKPAHHIFPVQFQLKDPSATYLCFQPEGLLHPATLGKARPTEDQGSGRIKQVFLNLYLNAVQAMKQVGLSINLEKK